MKYIIILSILIAPVYGYWEISNDVPTVFSADGQEEWRLWMGLAEADELFNNSSGILFDDTRESVIVGKFTPGAEQEAVTTVGYYAGQGHFVGTLCSFGTYSGQYNSDIDGSSFGYTTGRYNTGSGHAAFGATAGYANEGDSNTALGAYAFNAFNQDTANEKAIDTVDFANNQVVVNGGHGFGSNNTYRNLIASTTDTLPSGLSIFTQLWQVVDSTTLVCISDSFTDAGIGTLTLTPQFIYENSTALGTNAEPDASNQVMLGNTNVTEVKTSGSISASGLTLSVVRITSSPYNILASDYNIYVDTDGGDITINLPVGADGKSYRIVNVGSSDNDVILTPNGAELLNGVNANEMIYDGEKFILSYETTEGWW